MPEICPRCGLPKELCVCDILDKEGSKKVKVFTAKRKFMKYVTIVEGLSSDELDKTAKELKRLLACGGTTKHGAIELQGDHKDAVKKALLSLGYSEDSIDVA
ncbi:MAG: stress response translation initiation inhibitor YciH [Candidatus Micrarchaeaceae archaeon]